MAKKTKEKVFEIDRIKLNDQLSTNDACNWVILEIMNRYDSGKEVGIVSKTFLEIIGIGRYN